MDGAQIMSLPHPFATGSQAVFIRWQRRMETNGAHILLHAFDEAPYHTLHVADKVESYHVFGATPFPNFPYRTTSSVLVMPTFVI